MKSLVFVLTSAMTVLGVSATHAAPIVISGVAVNAAGITPIRDAYRTALGGGTVAGANGSFGGLRREINWDGVGDGFSDPGLLPADFFNVNSPRGVVLSSPAGPFFQVSANAGVIPTEFSTFNASYSSTFEAFSAQRLFTAFFSNVTDVSFFLLGTATPAVTSGFGAIFSDVDLPISSIQYFDAFGASLGTFVVPSMPGNETFSFLGVVFDSPVVSRVRISAGHVPPSFGAPDGGLTSTDVVVMDDFLYGEPQLQTPVPEPATLLLFGAGAIVLARRRLRAKKSS